MKKVYYVLVLLLGLSINGYTQNNLCSTAYPFAAGTTLDFPAGVNAGIAESGPAYGCMASQPNPAWYYMLVDQSGPIELQLSTYPGQDIDFACWGPFTSSSACTELTSNCTNCPNNSVDPGFYPSGNLVDCSYSPDWQEFCHISNALSGQFYMFVITNYSNQACNIVFSQTNTSVTLHGTTSLSILNGTDVAHNSVTKEVSVFPNPFSSSTTIRFYNPANKSCLIRITDVTGKTIREYSNIETNSLRVEKGDLAQGIYTIEVLGDRAQKGKLIIE